jgi:hypothetical protein
MLEEDSSMGLAKWRNGTPEIKPPVDVLKSINRRLLERRGGAMEEKEASYSCFFQ